MAKQLVDRLTRVRCRTHTLDLYATEERDPLSRLYGSEAVRIADRMPLSDDLPHVWGEVDHAIEWEMARSVIDVLCRRMRIALYAEDRGVALAPRVAERMAPRFGWDRREIARQIDAYHEELAANYPR